MADRAFPDALPTDYRLHWYVLVRVLGQGGFGITYLARDTNLEQMVAVKEFLPVEMATRLPDATVRCRTDELREHYRWGLERFIQEARTLAKFDHANIVRVHSVFEANDTAYMVMRFEEGHNLAAQLERRRTLPEPELQRILLAILDGLELVHNAGFIHRDIKPDNIHIRADGTPVLLDFGSARHAIGKARTMTILVAPGYAPIEQYYSDPEGQGPWTDIYALAATCYRAIAGVAPMDAITRSKGILGRADDVLVPASVIGRGRYSERLLAAIDHGLAFAETDRPQSVAEWRREIVGEPVTEQRTAAPAGTHTAPSPAGAPAPAPALPPVSPQPRPKRSFPLTAIAWSIGVIAAAAIGIAVLVQLDKQNILITSQGALIKELQDKKRPEEPAEKSRAPEPPREEPPVTPPDVTSKRVEPLKPQADKPRTEAKPPPKQAVVVIPSDKPTVPKRPPDEPRRQLPDTQPSIAPQEPQSLAPQKIVPGEEKLAEAKPAPPDPMTEADQLEARGDHAGAFKILRALAEQGNARAQARVGNAYSQGRGVPRDDALAVTWYRRAAEQREGEAMLNLGHHYDQGRGIAKDLSYAYIWYSLALRAGVKAADEPRRKAHAQLQPAQIAQLDRLIEHRGRPQ